MRRPKVFISHSSKTPEGITFLEQVYTALDRHGGGQSFDVFLDREEIHTGEEWHKKILQNLCTCDAVVILLSKAALNSHWVRQEAAFSAMRRYGDLALKLVVVTLDDVTAQEIQACPYLGGVARLHDLQFAPKHKTPEDIIEELAGLTIRPYSPLGDLLLKMSETLEYIKPATLERAIRLLDCDCVATLNWNTHLAHTLALSVASEQYKALKNLSALMKDIGHVVGQEKARTLLHMVKHLWVNPDAATHLSNAHTQRIPITVNGFNPEDFTAGSYADRAWGKGNHWLVPVGNCRDMGSIEEVMRQSVGLQTMPQRYKDKLLKTTSEPILLVFPAPDEVAPDIDLLPDENLLKDIMGKYPTTVIFIPVGETSPDCRPDLQPIEPALDVAMEDEQYLNYCKVKQYIESM
ncbi:TIR domain-containing protein [Thiothrix eikelboomii]|uniref:TIR domain-containing protein n=1 Tax=Thiothrix eikelboomii TaxID=92487 RepID=A0A1T4WEZ2_9GAMM|nr:toll/interleukin-1 receptor domain-containing protein [Thiothrix eikelboomii]SKA75874.1 TIR domain-containing protein [Thiothrix eikelboomii]